MPRHSGPVLPLSLVTGDVACEDHTPVRPVLCKTHIYAEHIALCDVTMEVCYTHWGSFPNPRGKGFDAV